MIRFDYMIYSDETDKEIPLEKIFISETSSAKEDELVIKENELRSKLFDEYQDYNLGGQTSYDAYRIIMKALSEDLDNVHNQRYGRTLWEPMISRWLYVYVCCAYITYREILYLMKSNDSVYTYIPKVRYIGNLYNTIENDSVMFDQIRADIICAVLNLDISLFYEIKHGDPIEVIDEDKNLKYNDSLFTRIAKKMSIKHMQTGLFVPYLDGIGDGIWRVLSLGKVRNITLDEKLGCVSHEIDTHKRALIRRNFDDEFTNIAYKCIGRNIPSIAVEGFNYAYNYYKRQCIAIPRLLISSIGILSPIGAMLYSDVKNNNGRVYLIQHGGSYRYEKYTGYIDMPLADRFYTAGNGGKDTRLWNIWNMRAMPFGKTLGHRWSWNGSGRVLFACDVHPRYMARFCVRSELSSDDFYNTENNFIKHLSKETINKVRIRPLNIDLHDGEYRFDTIKQLRDDIRIDEIKFFYDSLAKSEMLIACYITTPVLEAISLGMPTLVILQNKWICVEEGAEEIIDKLIEEKVIITDAIEAAEYLDSICNDIRGWWNEPRRKKVCKEFREMYCSRSRLGRLKWIREIMRETRSVVKL